MASTAHAIAPAFVGQIRHLLLDSAAHGLGISVSSIDKSHHNLGAPCDRVTVSIPWSNTSLKWDVMFDAHNPTYPPDLIFAAADAPAFDLELVPSLHRDWDVTDDRCLTRAITDLLEQQRMHETTLVVRKGYKKLIHDLDSLRKVSGVQVYSNTEKEAFVMVLVLPLNEASAGNGPTMVKHGKRASLIVTYTVTGGRANISCSFRAPPHLPVTAMLQVPVWETSITPRAYQLTMAALIHERWTARHALLLALEELYPEQLERDEDDCGVVSFVAKLPASEEARAPAIRRDVFRAIVKVELSAKFPTLCPAILIQAMVTGARGTAPMVTLSNGYPYSPRWSSKELAARLQGVIAGEMERLASKIATGAV